MSVKNWGMAIATTGFLLSLGQTSQARPALTDDGLQFSEDTIVEFEFIKSHGAYRSTFGVIDLDSCQSSFGSIDLNTCQRTPLLVEDKPSDLPETVYRNSTYIDNSDSNKNQDFLGTPGNAVSKPMAEFLFKAGKRYAFYLESSFEGMPAGIKYSTAIYNPKNSKQALFLDTPNPEFLQARRRNTPDIQISPELEAELGQLINGGIVIRWDDTGSLLVSEEQKDFDFDDFIIGVGGELDCY